MRLHRWMTFEQEDEVRLPKLGVVLTLLIPLAARATTINSASVLSHVGETVTVGSVLI
jgi:hypothetical protein